MTSKSYNQFCGLAYALDRVGERWTLLIIRELFPGPRRYTDLMDGLPGISTNLLSKRLKVLEEDGLIRQRVLPPPAGSTVYELTPAGRDLESTLLELGKWGSRFVPPAPGDDAPLHLGSYALTLKTFFQPERARGVTDTYQLVIDDEPLNVQIEDGSLRIRQGEWPGADLTLHADLPTYLSLLRKQIEPGEALARGRIRVEGDPQALDRFLELCGVPA